ncbi:CHAP domain-containing protein [Actinomadura viridis]|uniref:CHAP domain-containing protein n=1 Tax=Actinomadura viridis TaxID=58110 RepID=UPI0036AE7635
MSFRDYSGLLAAVRERAGELTSQTLGLRGKAAAGVAGGAAIGVLALGSAVGGTVAAADTSADARRASAGATSGAPSGAPSVAEAAVRQSAPGERLDAPGERLGSAGERLGSAAGRLGSPGEALDSPGERLGSAAERLDAAAKALGSGKGAMPAAPEVAGKPARVKGSTGVVQKGGLTEAQVAQGPSATVDEVLKLAAKQVGISEGKRGQTKFHDWYVSTESARKTAERDGGRVSSYNGAAWCNMFVSWVGSQTGLKGMGWDAYTVSHAQWFKKTDRWGQKAKPGAVVFFNWGQGGIGGIEHVGLVVKDNGNGTISTIEGNAEDKVKKKIRKKSQVAGYGYPDYRK